MSVDWGPASEECERECGVDFDWYGVFCVLVRFVGVFEVDFCDFGEVSDVEKEGWELVGQPQGEVSE